MAQGQSNPLTAPTKDVLTDEEMQALQGKSSSSPDVLTDEEMSALQSKTSLPDFSKMESAYDAKHPGYGQQMLDYGKNLWDTFVTKPFQAWRSGDVPGMIKPATDIIQGIGDQYGWGGSAYKPTQGGSVGGLDLYGLIPFLGPKITQLNEAKDPATAGALFTQLLGEVSAMKALPAIKNIAKAYLTRGFNPKTGLFNAQPAPEAEITPTVRSTEMAGKLARTGVNQAETLDSYQLGKITQPIQQQVAQQMKLTERPIGASRTGNLIDETNVAREVAQKALKLEDGMMDFVEKPLNTVINLRGNIKVPQVKAEILADIDSKISNLHNQDAVKSALQKFREEVNQYGDTVSGLYDTKVRFNKIFQRLGSSPQGQQIAGTIESADAARLAGNSIRSKLYPQLQSWEGPDSNLDLSELGRREGAIIQRRNGVYNSYKDADAAHSEWASEPWYNRILSRTQSGGSASNRAMGIRATKAAIGQSPLAKFNSDYWKAAGDAGNGMVPESVNLDLTGPESWRTPPDTNLIGPTPGSRMQLPAGPGGEFKFNLGTENPASYGIEARTGQKLITGATGQKPKFTIRSEAPITELSRMDIPEFKNIYIGEQETPYTSYPGHEPIQPTPPQEGTSWFRQEQQLSGPTARTIPNSVRGYRSASKFREDQLGSSQAAIPERSFTGPKTQTTTNWQKIQEPGEPLTPPSGPGTLTTSDPTVVERTISSIDEQLKSGKIADAEKVRLSNIRNDLVNQIAQYKSGVQSTAGIGTQGYKLNYQMGPGGVFTTSDPTVVVKTIAELNNQIKHGNLPPSEVSRLTSTRNGLQQQLDLYQTYQKPENIPPSIRVKLTPMKKGAKPIVPSLAPIAPATYATNPKNES